jgi:hypothetical protein
MVPVKVRKQGEMVWIKLISYFRAHVGAQRKGTGCVVIKRLNRLACSCQSVMQGD